MPAQIGYALKAFQCSKCKGKILNQEYYWRVDSWRVCAQTYKGVSRWHKPEYPEIKS